MQPKGTNISQHFAANEQSLLERGNKRLGTIAGLVLVMATLVVIFTRLPLGTALEFVEDEGYEVMKAFLCTKGFVLYKDIWNDQPPVHTMLLTECFKIWGPSILVGRLLAAGFGLLLFGMFYGLVRQRSSVRCALISSFLLLCSPLVLTLSSSVMLEVPAIGTALCSAFLLRKWCEKPRWGWLVGSACVMGIALQMKLTAVVIAPAILAEIILRAKDLGEDWRRRASLNLLAWGVTVSFLFLFLGMTVAKGSLGSSLKSHLTILPPALVFSKNASDFPIEWRLFYRHLECVLGAAFGIFWAIRKGHFREIAFPTILLGTVLFIHLLHRPWWNYYYLHFAVPLAWLSGWGVNETLKYAISGFSAGRSVLSSGRVWTGAALGLLIAAVLARSESRLEAGIKQLRESPKINTSALLAAMRRSASVTRWVCAVDVVYPFHAQLCVPPELAVVMAKRFWSGQISTSEIIDLCGKYKPEQILLPNGHTGAEWRGFLSNGYELSFAEKDYVLYVYKEGYGSSKLQKSE